MPYAYTADSCPTKHDNPGNDICADCGLYLNVAGPNPPTDPAKLARAQRLGYTLRQDTDEEDGAVIWSFVKPDGEPDSEWFALEELAWDAAAGDSGLWAVDHGDPGDPGDGVGFPLPCAPWIEATETAPEMRLVPVISTAHLTPQTLRYMNETPSKDWPFSGGLIDHGFYLYAHDDPEAMPLVPADLKAIHAWAVERRFTYIHLDCDAEAAPVLPTYEH